MRIYCTHEADIAMSGIARQMGLMLHEWDDIRQPSRGRFAGHESAAKLLLRPRTGSPDAELFRSGRHDGRRIWAASWAGHYVFMRAVFTIDPDAIIHTSHAEYRGIGDFLAKAPGTAWRNVGSMIQPQSYRDAEAPGHIYWGDVEDLELLAIEYTS